MPLWRYCPACYAPDTLRRYCATCPGVRLQVLPISRDLLEATHRIGGSEAVQELVIAVLAPEKVAGYLREKHELEEDLRVIAAWPDIWSAPLVKRLK